MQATPFTVFLYALATAIATGLGAIPFFFFKKISRRALGIANAVAAGLMLTASFTLIFEGIDHGLWKTIGGIFLGLVFIVICDRWLDGTGDLAISNLRGADARKAILIMGVMTLHSFTEGVGVGVSFGGGNELGIFITAAIALHNVPEGLAISLIMIPRGMRVFTTMGYCILSSIPQPIMALPAFLFVESFSPFLPVGLGFAAGAMIWMVFSEIIPEANRDSDTSEIGITITLAVAFMLIFNHFLH